MSLSKMGIKSLLAALLFVLFSNINAMCLDDQKVQVEESSSAISETVFEDFYIDECGILTAYNGKSKNVVIPDSVKVIAFGAFMEHDEIESVEFPESVSYIDEYAFYGCDNLAQVILPESVQKIGRLAFGNCKKLEMVYIGQNFCEMGEFVFWGCEKLYCISVSDENSCFCSIDGLLYSKDRKKLFCCPEGYVGEVVIDDNVVTVNVYAFFDCRKVSKITVGKNALYIDEGAFYCCEDLKDVVFGPKVKKIRSAAFERCAKLGKIVIPKTVKSLGNSVFGECTSLKEIRFLNKKTEIPDDILSKNAETVIFGYNGSTAQEYAKDNKLVFKRI